MNEVGIAYANLSGPNTPYTRLMIVVFFLTYVF